MIGKQAYKKHPLLAHKSAELGVKDAFLMSSQAPARIVLVLPYQFNSSGTEIRNIILRMANPSLSPPGHGQVVRTPKYTAVPLLVPDGRHYRWCCM